MPLSSPDPLGSAILAYWTGNKKAAITVLTEQADSDELPVSYLFRTPAQMPRRERFTLDQCRGRVLDVGAGAGSHALALQQKGTDVTALEISVKAAQVAKERGVQNIISGDFFTLPPQPFDTLLLLMNGIGLAGNLNQLPNFLETCQKWLAPGGQVLLESSDILYLYEEEDGSVLLDLNAGYYGELTYVMEFGQERSASFPWLFLDYDLLQQHAHAAGWETEMLLQEEDAHYIARLTRPA